MKSTPWSTTIEAAAADAGLTVCTRHDPPGWLTVTFEEHLNQAAMDAATTAFEAAGFDRVSWFTDAASIVAEREARLAKPQGADVAGATMAEWEAHAARVAMGKCCDGDDPTAEKDAYVAEKDALTYAGVPRG
jgi:hypothetical protein